jgi:ubiquinone/menaquinone biosynthesis C-methylase UbiE
VLSGEITKSAAMTEELRAYYCENATKYDLPFDCLGFRVLDAVTWKYLEPFVPTDANAFVLDAGGGTGRWAIPIARKGSNVVLIDVTQEMLKVAAEKIRKEGLQRRISVEKGDITQVGHADRSFDLVFCEQALFLFKRPSILLKEMRRVLKRGARLVISAQNLYVQCLAALSENPKVEDVEKTLRLLQRKEYSTMTKDRKVKIYTWKPNEFRSLLERNGFRIERIVGKGTTMPLRISTEVFMKKDYDENLFQRILQFELAMCERPDALPLAGHLQAIARRQ